MRKPTNLTSCDDFLLRTADRRNFEMIFSNDDNNYYYEDDDDRGKHKSQALE